MKLLEKLARRWHKFYQSSSFQLVLSLSFTAVAVIGMAFLGITLALRFSGTTDTLRRESTQRVLSQVNLNLDNYLRSMMRVSDTAYYEVIKDADLATDSLTEKLQLLRENNRESVISVAVFDGQGRLLSAVPLASLKNSVVPEQQDWFRKALEKTENLHFSGSHVQNLFHDTDYSYRWVISLSRQVELTQGGVTSDGVLLVDMSAAGIARICKNVTLDSARSYVYLITGDGELIYHPHQQLVHAGLEQENNLAAAGYADGTYTEKFQGVSRQVTVKTVGYTGWKLVGVTPSTGLWNDYGMILAFFLFIVFLSMFLLVFANLRLAEWITKPIKQLDKAVRAMEAGGELGNMNVGGPYEVEHLSRSIESMVSTLRHLMDDIIQQEAQKRRSELDVLQSQINPHFLYNTLDSVVWMAENGRTEDAVVMLTSLGRFFRISLSRGSAVISVAEELEHARHYLTIQKMRYKNKFSAVITADDGVGELGTIKLIVQPVLENAIYHGMEYADGDGEINIHAGLDGGDVVISVRDNGPGMPEEVVSRLLDSGGSAAAPGAKGSGIGLRNVHRRLRLTYGDAYGLTIRSEPDAGTTVFIRLPAMDRQTAERLQEGER